VLSEFQNFPTSISVTVLSQVGNVMHI